MWFALKRLCLSSQISFFNGFKSTRGLTSLQFYDVEAYQKLISDGKAIYEGGKFSRPKSLNLSSIKHLSLNIPFRCFSESYSNKSMNLDPDTQNKIIESNEEERNRSIYLANLPPDTSRNDLKKLFMSYGEIENVATSSSANKLPKNCGIIVFKDQTSAENAIKLGSIDTGSYSIKILPRKSKLSKNLSVCVKYLPRDASEDEIKEIFADCGNIIRMHFPIDRFGNKIDACFIQFETIDQAEAAVAKDRMVFRNFPLDVKLITDENRRIEGVYKRRDSFSVALGNLPFHGIEEKDVKEFFSQCGKIVNIYLVKRPNGKLMGNGFIEFSSQEEVQKAINLENKMLGGREIRISQKKSNANNK